MTMALVTGNISQVTLSSSNKTHSLRKRIAIGFPHSQEEKGPAERVSCQIYFKNRKDANLE